MRYFIIKVSLWMVLIQKSIEKPTSYKSSSIYFRKACCYAVFRLTSASLWRFSGLISELPSTYILGD